MLDPAGSWEILGQFDLADGDGTQIARLARRGVRPISKAIARVEVVPWSMARIRLMDFLPAAAWATPTLRFMGAYDHAPAQL